MNSKTKKIFSITWLTLCALSSCGKAVKLRDAPQAATDHPTTGADGRKVCTSGKVSQAVRGCLVAKSDVYLQRIEFSLDQLGKAGSFSDADLDTQYFQGRYHLSSAEKDCLVSELCN